MASSPSDSAPSLPAVPVPVPVASQSPAGLLMYKNRLQEFTTRSGIATPVYQTANEGQPHDTKFRSTVWVARISYTSQSTFPHKKAAEQEVSRLALEIILPKETRDEGPSLLSQISPFCKSIINEYACKLHIEGPSYNTVQQQIGALPVFTASLFFNGTSYAGDPARTKREAEQSAAHAAILSIMGDSSSGIKLRKIIKSNSLFYDAIKGKGESLLQANAVLSTPNSEHIPPTLDPKDAVLPGSVTDNGEVKVDYPESSEIQSTCQTFQIPKQESSLQATLPLHPGSAHSIDDDSSSKRHRKNKKRANKKSRLLIKKN